MMTGKTIPENDLLTLIEAALYAPSAFNAQPERFYYAKQGDKSFTDLIQLLSAFNQNWCKKAAFLIIVVSKKTFEHNGKFDRTHSFDSGAAWQAFAIEGVNRNFVVHAMSGFDYDKAKQYLKLGDDYDVECMIAVGQPSDEVNQEKITLRKPVKEIAIKLT